MQQTAPAIAVHGDYRIEILSLEISIRPGAREYFEQLLLAPSLHTGLDAGGDDLLRQDVQRRRRLRRAIQITSRRGAQQRGRFNQLVNGERK